MTTATLITLRLATDKEVRRGRYFAVYAEKGSEMAKRFGRFGWHRVNVSTSTKEA